MMSRMKPAYERLLQLITEQRKRKGLERQIDLVRATGLSKSTVHRLETGQELGESALRLLSKGIGWTGDSAEDVLAGGEPTEVDPTEVELESRYHREPTTEGKLVGLVDDMIYAAFIAAAPDTPLIELDKAKRAAFDVLRSNGIQIALRHGEASNGTEADQ